jgi:hypothetical protein
MAEPLDTHLRAFSLLKPSLDVSIGNHIAMVLAGNKVLDRLFQQFALIPMGAVSQFVQFGFEFRGYMECHGS